MKVYTVNEIAEMLDVSCTAVRHWIADGRLKTTHPEGYSRRVVITESDLKAYLKLKPMYKAAMAARDELVKYLDEKLKVLKQLGFTLTDNQLKYIKSLKSEYQIDAFAHDLIMGRPMVK